MATNLLLRLRLQHGMTQEELSERSGISVRTIRNFERGTIHSPRRSSVDMLLSILDPGLQQRLWSSARTGTCRPADVMAGRVRLADPAPGTWRGGRPPRTSLLGRDPDIELLADMVIDHQVVVVTGPGGVGKSRVAQAAAEQTAHRFPSGVAVAEMGRVPAERRADGALEPALAAVTALFQDAAGARDDRVLLLLDNTEHLARTTPYLVQRLLTEHPRLHIMITSRRPPLLPGAGIWELAPLDEPTAADLLVDRARTSCPTLDLASDRPEALELVRRLDGLPRLVEFAAHRLRTVPLATLLAGGPGSSLFGSADGTALPHQRTPEASLRWSLDQLDERHHVLLARLAERHPADVPFTADDLTADGTPAAVETLELLADLVDASLLQVRRGHRYEFRLLRHVQALLSGTVGPPVPQRQAGDRPVAGPSQRRHRRAGAACATSM